MSKVAIEVKNVSKEYRLGVFGTGMLSTDIKRWWYRIRGKEDPFRLVTAENDRTTVSESEFVWALKDINFSVKQGEVLGIIGRNGAGKSTLLKVLSQVTPPSTGSIKARGRIASLLEVYRYAPRAYWEGKHISQWFDFGDEQSRDFIKTRRDCRIFRLREVHRHPS